MNRRTDASETANGENRAAPIPAPMLGACPAIAVTANVYGALGMGLAVLTVLICSDALLFLLRRIISDRIRIPCYTVIIAGVSAAVQMCIRAFLPNLYGLLGTYLPLTAAVCIVLTRIAPHITRSTHTGTHSALAAGIGVTLTLCAAAAVREIFGAGSIAGHAIPFMQRYKIEFLTKAPGCMLVYAFLIAAVIAVTGIGTTGKPSGSGGGSFGTLRCKQNSRTADVTDREGR